MHWKTRQTQMRWFERLAAWLEAKHPERVRVIPDRYTGQGEYIKRYYLIGSRKSRWFTLVLHRIFCSDPDGLHDHPWAWATLILAGGYWETEPGGRYWRGPGNWRIRGARALHRLELQPGSGPVWTLFAMGPRIRDWGFMTPRGWVDHQTHLGVTDE